MTSLQLKSRPRSMRLEGYDYSQPGGYFVTVCTHNRMCLFGEIASDEMWLNKVGRIAKDEWLRTLTIRSEIQLDEFVVMPNHLHGIVLIRPQQNDSVVGANSNSPLQKVPFRSPSKTIGSLVRGFKSASTRRINALRNLPGVPVWQRNF